MDVPPTLPPRSTGSHGTLPQPTEHAALVLIWSREEPDRVGEVLLVPPLAGSRRCLFGRGGASVGGMEYLNLCRQRPGANASTGFPTSPHISRTQLRIHSDGGAALSIENLGRCALRHEGIEVNRTRILPGEVLDLQNELMFLCVKRPSLLPPWPRECAVPGGRFGEADAQGLVGESPALWEVRRQLAFCAPLEKTHVLITGASGCGKELVAQALHHLSPRRARALVSRSAATFTETLADAELFGTARDFPQKGMPERKGLIGEADQSTLFLDEIGELPVAIQVKLLRVLDQQGEYQRLGESQVRHSDFRLVAATNRPPSALKADVLARMKMRIELPDLNARREDVPLLVRHLLRRITRENPTLAAARGWPAEPPALPVSLALSRALVQHSYQTHLRELEAYLWTALNEPGEGRLQVSDRLREAMSASAGRARGRGAPVATPVAVAAETEGRGGGARALEPARPEIGLEPADLTPDEAEKLAVLRRWEFSPTAAARDPAYVGNRQKADLHLRQLFCRVLALAAWDPARASRLLAGPGGEPLELRVRARLMTFLRNLEMRVRESHQLPEGRAALMDALAREYKGYRTDVWRLVEWIETTL